MFQSESCTAGGREKNGITRAPGNELHQNCTRLADPCGAQHPVSLSLGRLGVYSLKELDCRPGDQPLEISILTQV